MSQRTCTAAPNSPLTLRVFLMVVLKLFSMGERRKITFKNFN
jgi:hypothetical protein